MHFTYASPDSTNLEQGDLLRRTPEIDSLLETVHPHYHQKTDYRYLLVLTQTCDLVRRAGEVCKTRYISLAAVRPLEVVIGRELSKHQRSSVERKGNFCDEASKVHLRQFLSKLLNNNQSNFFYLEAEPEVGLSEAHCAFLTLSVAVKAEQHYQTCLDARILRLRESFQHKLGWLTGNMYSRVGTEDWVPNTKTNAEFSEYVESLLDERVLWVDTERKKRFTKRLKALDPEALTTETVLSEYEALCRELPKKKDLLLKKIGEILVDLKVEESVIRKTKNRLANDPEVAKIVR